MSDDRKIAMFIDFENIALGVRDAQYKQFDINLVLERLSRRARSSSRGPTPTGTATRTTSARFHEAAIELIDDPAEPLHGKNSADIRMVVDAMDLAYAKEHVDTFVLVSGDSDFSPLVSKLKENDKLRHRHRGQELLVEAAGRQLRRVHLLRGPRPRVAEDHRAARA